jgi:hypothetical protein
LAHFLFRYIRYNAELTKEGLAALGVRDVDPDAVQKLLGRCHSVARAHWRSGRSAADYPSHFNFEVFRP